jgi:hypothetical protein
MKTSLLKKNNHRFKYEMKSRAVNIILLTLFHFVIFTFSVTVKITHYHKTSDNEIATNLHSQNISTEKNPCPICQFEFVTFFNEPLPLFGINFNLQPVILGQYHTLIYYTPLQVPSNRAPPEIV